MLVLVVASQKGGSGKTTVAAHLAVQATLSGFGPTALIDTDPQGSLADWWNVRAAEDPVFIDTGVERLAGDIERMRSLGFKLLVIDTPPAITETIGQVMAHADLVIIPARPSPHDLRAAGHTVELAEAARKPIIFVINGAAPRARITSEAAIALSQHGTLAPAILHQRTDFAASMIDGRTVMELAGAPRSTGEIEQLWTYVSGRVIGTQRPTLMPGRRQPAPHGPIVAEGAR